VLICKGLPKVTGQISGQPGSGLLPIARRAVLLALMRADGFLRQLARATKDQEEFPLIYVAASQH